MTLEEITKLVDGDPKMLIEEMGKLGLDFSDIEKDIHRYMVKKRFALTDKEIEAVDFVFWVAYYVEREAESLIIEPEVHIGARRDVIQSLVSSLHFGGKIKMIEEIYTGNKDPLVKLMRRIQDFRNEIAHGRFHQLEYGGFHLSDNRGKLLLIGNLRDVFRKKNI